MQSLSQGYASLNTTAMPQVIQHQCKLLLQVHPIVKTLMFTDSDVPISLVHNQAQT